MRVVRASKRVYAPVSGESMTKQAHVAECDINMIMKRARATGQLPSLIKSNPAYGDFSDVPSYQESLERVIFAERQFASLPAVVRARFGNDPEGFLEFANDPSNASEMISLGLATKREPKATLDDVVSALKADSEGPGKASGPAGRPAKGGTPKARSASSPEED